MRRAMTIVGAVALAVSACGAGAAEVRVWTEPEDVYLGVPFQLMVQASGGSVGEFNLPAFDGLVVEEPPNVRRDQMRFSLGSREEVRVRGYRARATRTGPIRVPPVTARIDGREVRSNALTLTVREPSERQPDPRVRDYVLLKSEVASEKAYLGEPIEFTTRLYELQHRSVMVEAVALELPETEGFYSVQFDDNPRPQYPETVLLEGRRYVEALRRRKLLCPTRTGTLTVGAARLQANIYVGSGFQTQRFSEVFTSEPATVEVLPLPPAPASFSGGVGQLTVSAAVPRDAARQGVPLDVLVEVRGQGNPDAISGPKLPGGRAFSVREPVSRVEWLGGDPPAMSKTFVYSVTPLESGALTIPAFPFCHFDPEREDYVVEELGPFLLNVLPAGDPGRHMVVDEGLREPEPDSQSITTDIRGFRGRGGPLRAGGGVLPGQTAALVAAPPVLYAALALALARRRRLASDMGYARSVRARAQARRKLAAVAGSEDPMAALYRVLRTYLADRTGADAGGMTADDARRLLAERGVDDAIVREVYRLLRMCERARYAGDRPDAAEAERLADQVRDAIDRLEPALKGGAQ